MTDQKQNSKLGSIPYLYEEINRLRKAWGDTSFWDDMGRADRYLDGLTYVYLNTDDLTPEAKSFFSATANEFTMRQAMVLKMKLQKLRESL
jgi:hypothetical protein